jgi:hypothetical protein
MRYEVGDYVWYGGNLFRITIKQGGNYFYAIDRVVGGRYNYLHNVPIHKLIPCKKEVADVIRGVYESR